MPTPLFAAADASPFDDAVSFLLMPPPFYAHMPLIDAADAAAFLAAFRRFFDVILMMPPAILFFA